MGKGFYVRHKTYKLTWAEGEELEGLEVRAKAIPFRTYLVVASLLDGDPPDVYEDTEDCDRDGTPTVYEFKDNPGSQFRFLVKAFSRALMDWNLTDDDGTPVPANEAGIWAQDREFVILTIRAWVDGLASVARPLERPSPAGVPLAGESIPMEPLSESLAS
jgi:hypothetical protein